MVSNPKTAVDRKTESGTRASPQSASLADRMTAALHVEEGALYCAGTVALGGDEFGFAPPDKLTAKCEASVAKAVRKLAGCTSKCEIAQADDALKTMSSDKLACEVGLPKSCRQKYDATSARLEAAEGCPGCLASPARAAVADAARRLLDQLQPQIYCAGTTPLP